MLKQGETFAVFDRLGDVRPVGLGEEGLYHEGTRFLSRLTLRLAGKLPMLLSSTVREDNTLLSANLTNPDIFTEGRLTLPRDTVHILREYFLTEATLHCRLLVRNFGVTEVQVPLEQSLGSDFVDIFEVRGEKRPARGKIHAPRHESDWLELSYDGLDGVRRQTIVCLNPPPQRMEGTVAHLPLRIPPHGEAELFATVSCHAEPVAGENERAAAPPRRKEDRDSFGGALARLDELSRVQRAADAQIHTNSRTFNAWLGRSAADLHLMVTQTEHGPYAFAGVPWFNTVFGRDGIISAFEYLWVNPALARGVLQYLAATQATEHEPERDAQPGKILHEMRKGEMANLGEIPFGRYYGTVDATPLFVFLAGVYYQRTADLATIRAIWPNIQRALKWISEHGDADGDGFVDYARQSKTGLSTQGWKDSADSVFHADGSLARPPIALCEVQGYAFAAWEAAATLSEALGEPEAAADYRRRAQELQTRFEEAFWIEELSTYALALDANKQPCRVKTSNPGHCLFARIASPERARRVAQTLLDESSFSGWGIRTVANTEARYNPMSYHNGSIWPHDNALIAVGLARYGFTQDALRVMTGMFDASTWFDLHRLPELFCGFVRREGEGPTLYPVACAPQTWAAGAVFLMLQAVLGLKIDAVERRVRFVRPALPPFLEQVTIRNIQVADATLDIGFHRYPGDVGVTVLRRSGEVEVVVVR